MVIPGPGIGGAPCLHLGREAGKRVSGSVRATAGLLCALVDSSSLPRCPAVPLSTTSEPPSSICCSRYLRHSSAKGFLHYVENRLRHFAFRLERENTAAAVPSEERHPISILFEPGPRLQGVVHHDQVEGLPLQLRQPLGQGVP